MTKRQRAKLVRSLLMSDADRTTLADDLYEARVETYVDTLVELAEELGFDLPTPFDLSETILDALDAASERSADQIVNTYNERALTFGQNLPDDISAAEARAAADAMAQLHWEKQAVNIATTEAYEAHHDATVHFFTANGLEPLWDFGGHGDAHPECALCERLFRGGPWTTEVVQRVGVPHNLCAQSWHPRTDDADLPDQIVVGDGETGGIVGNDPLVIRAGGVDAALAILEQE